MTLLIWRRILLMTSFLPLIAALGIGLPMASYWELTSLGTGLLCCGLCTLFILLGSHS